MRRVNQAGRWRSLCVGKLVAASCRWPNGQFVAAFHGSNPKTALSARASRRDTGGHKIAFVFGQRNVDLRWRGAILMKNMLATEHVGALSMSFLKTADGPRPAPRPAARMPSALLRILTPTLKFRATPRARKFCAMRLEMRGPPGRIGYIEIRPRGLLRDAHLGSSGKSTAIIRPRPRRAESGRFGPPWRDAAAGSRSHSRLVRQRHVSAWPGAIVLSRTPTRHRLRPRFAGNRQRGRARRATILLYHVCSAVALWAWEAGPASNRMPRRTGPPAAGCRAW